MQTPLKEQIQLVQKLLKRARLTKLKRNVISLNDIASSLVALKYLTTKTSDCKIAYWDGCLVKVLKEHSTGECNIEISYPGKISKNLLVNKTELSPVNLLSI